jgi:hypothetical protein
MSVRENIEIFHQFDTKTYLEILKDEYGAREHPAQPGSFLIDDPELPFYGPREADDHISILGFNYALLSNLLIQAIIDHPEMVPDEALVRWTQEQDLVLEKTAGQLRSGDIYRNEP